MKKKKTRIEKHPEMTRTRSIKQLLVGAKRSFQSKSTGAPTEPTEHHPPKDIDSTVCSKEGKEAERPTTTKTIRRDMPQRGAAEGPTITTTMTREQDGHYCMLQQYSK